MDLSLVFDRGNNVYTAMHLSQEDMDAIRAHRETTADYSFLYNRDLLARVLGHEPASWSPESFTAYEDGTRLLVRVDGGPEREMELSAVNVIFGEVKPTPPPPPSPDGPPAAMVVLGCQGGGLIEYVWSGLTGPLDPAPFTLRITTQAHRGQAILVIEEVQYADYLADQEAPESPRPDWLWEPSFFTAEDLA